MVCFQQNLWQEYVGAIATPLVGRGSEVKRIHNAIISDKSNVLFVLGPGGIGKTFLVRDILKRYSLGGEWYQPDVLVTSDIVDFYSTDNHALEGLTSNISENMSCDGEYFKRFNLKFEEFITQKYDLQGQGQVLQDSRGILLDCFVEDLKELASKVSHIIFAFDTIERLFSAPSFFKEDLYQIEAREWLRDTFLPEIVKLNNITVLLAGRPESTLFVDEVSKSLGKCNIGLIRLESLDVDAIKAYFSEVSQQIQSLTGRMVEVPHDVYTPTEPSSSTILDALTDTQILALQQYTEGRPILLSLMVDYLVNASPLHPQLFETTVDNLEVIREEIIESILKFWQTKIRGLDSVIELLAWASKGVDRFLLTRVLDVSLDEATIMLVNLKKLAFIKTRPSDERCFLHDEMLVFVRQYILPGGTFTKDIYNTIIRYYDGYVSDVRVVIADIAKETVKQVGEQQNKESDTKKTQSAKVLKSQDLADNLIKLRRSISENSFYRLMQASESSVEYVWLSANEGFWSHEAEWIALLQSVVMEYMNFMSQPCLAQIVVLKGLLELLDKVIRYDYGYMLNSIDNVADDYIAALETAGDIWRAEFDLLKLTARVYLGEVVDKELLELVNHIDEFGSNGSSKKRLQAKVYNLIGYTLRVKGDYHSAIMWYEKSRNFWRDLEYSEQDSSFATHLKAQYANTLNNLAWAYAEVGKLGRAVRVGADALESRFALGPLSPVALSQNTLGLIHIRNAEPAMGTTLCQQALNIFEDLELWRGVGMAKTALAEALRRSADLEYLYPSNKKYQVFSESARHIEEAVAIFSDKVLEPVRLLEAYIEAGCVYRDWAWLDVKLGYDANEHYEKGYRYLTRAIEAAKELALMHKEVDAQVNRAWLYFYVGKIKDAQDECNFVINKFPKICLSFQVKDDFNRTCTIWSQFLGKTYLLLGEIARRYAEDKYVDGQALTQSCKQYLRDAGKNYALSLAYDQRYASDFRDFRRAKDLIYDHIKVFGRERMYELWQGVLEVGEECNLDPSLNKMRDLIKEYFGMMD